MPDVQKSEHGACTVLRIVGPFGASIGEPGPAARLRDVMLSIPTPPCVVLDLGAMTSWDDATIGALIAAGKRAWSAGGWLVIAAAAPDLVERFRAAALPFELYDTTADAVAAFGQG
ncbi:STAS domain-containing protein [Nonomuraea typhae]|uniref:STAS domain-containing protein n=1 Tax=Nonomuraea typhae TaxID=2603600 RepID=A0ABW7YVJ8_9ACTN